MYKAGRSGDRGGGGRWASRRPSALTFPPKFLNSGSTDSDTKSKAGINRHLYRNTERLSTHIALIVNLRRFLGVLNNRECKTIKNVLNGFKRHLNAFYKEVINR